MTEQELQLQLEEIVQQWEVAQNAADNLSCRAQEIRDEIYRVRWGIAAGDTIITTQSFFARHSAPRDRGVDWSDYYPEGSELKIQYIYSDGRCVLESDRAILSVIPAAETVREMREAYLAQNKEG